MKRFLSMVLVFALTVSLMSVFGLAHADTAQVTLKGWSSFSFTDSTGIKSYNDQLSWQEIAKKTGIKVEWTTVSGVDRETQFGLLMASGDLPDFVLDINPLYLEEYGRKGAFIPLNNLIPEMPALSALLAQDPEAVGSITSADGNIYFYPRLLLDLRTRCWPGFMIRNDWLQQLNIAVPESLDDMYKALKAIKENIPTATKPYTGDIKPFIWAFGVGSRGTGNGNDDFFVEDGTIKFGPTDIRYKAALEFLNKMVTEGIIDPEWNGIPGDQITTNIITDVSASTFGSFSGFLSKFNGLFEKDGRVAPLVAVAPLVGPNGTRGTLGRHTSIDLGYGAAITSTSKQAADVAKLFDFTYSEEGRSIIYFGVEGVTYTVVDGVNKFTDTVKTSDLGILGYLNNYSANTSCYPSMLPVEFYWSTLRPEGQEGNNITAQNAGTKKVPAIRFTAEEIVEVNAMLRDINSYVDENFANFVNGVKPLTEWDSFVAGFDGLRLNELTAIYNAAYTRFLAAVK